MSSRSSTGVNVGGSSILVIFVLLCLTTFATLSLVSAQADKKLTDKAAAAAVEFYAADSAAEEKLAAIDKAIKTAYLVEGTEQSFRNALQRSAPENVVFGADTVSYTVPVNERQNLEVELRIPFSPGGAAPRFERVKWLVVNTAEWTPPDDTLNLFGGEDDLPLFGGGDGSLPIFN